MHYLPAVVACVSEQKAYLHPHTHMPNDGKMIKMHIGTYDIK